jgi:hypothetical protein
MIICSCFRLEQFFYIGLHRNTKRVQHPFYKKPKDYAFIKWAKHGRQRMEIR